MKTRKKIATVFLLFFLVCVISAVIWYNSPAQLLRIDNDEVVSIYIFDGTQGKGANITAVDDINHIMDNLNFIEIKPTKLSLGYMGYGLRVKIFTKTGGSSNAAKTFIINSEYDVRNDPFFYEVVHGTIDLQFLEQQIKEEN